MGTMLKEFEHLSAKIERLEAENGRLRAELDDAIKDINDAANVLNYPDNQETENEATNEAYNVGFWQCAEIAIKRLEKIRQGGAQQ